MTWPTARDTEVFDIIDREVERQNTTIQLIASENFTSPTVLGLRLDQGGHLTHGSPVNASGKLYRFVAYGLTESDERIDFDQVRDVALAERPKIIVAGATAYSRIIDPRPFKEIADEIGALFMFDAAHVAGLIAGGQHPNPVEHGADIMTFTT